MAITYKNLPNVTFPIYELPTDSWKLEDGLLFFESRILDDTNMPGETLGMRRLQTPHRDQLHKLPKGIADFGGLLKSEAKFFIDWVGIPFEYEKTTMCSLVYYKIKRVELRETYSLLYVNGIPSPFTLKRPPSREYTWVGILHLYGIPWMLYEYSDKKLKNTRRKV